MATNNKKATKKRKIKKVVPEGFVHVHSTYSNTIVTITDLNGKTLTWSSAGALGFKGYKKSTPYAAQLAAQAAIKNAQDFGMTTMSVRLKGTGPGKDASVRQLQAMGINIKEIKDVTPIPHNGTTPKKKRL